MLELKNVSKFYNGKRALGDVNLSIGPGEIIGLFGENGAGKTTLLKAILTLIPHGGEISLDGKAIDRNNIARFAFATCEHSFFPNLTAKEHAEFYKEHFDRFNEKRFKGLMEFFELPMNRPIKKLSTGGQNQFEVIMALSQGADYILMDEPFAGNDVFNREDFYKVLLGILEEHETIILSTHLIEEVDHFIGRAILIHQGQIIGDVDVTELEEEGTNLLNYIKDAYGYRADRISKALNNITGE